MSGSHQRYRPGSAKPPRTSSKASTATGATSCSTIDEALLSDVANAF